jgi:hypothetical protein
MLVISENCDGIYYPSPYCIYTRGFSILPKGYRFYVKLPSKGQASIGIGRCNLTPGKILNQYVFNSEFTGQLR